MVSDMFFNKIIVPIEGLYAYVNSPTWESYKHFIEAQTSGSIKKPNARKLAKSYRKFAKKMKKAIKYLPEGLEVIVRAERKK